MPLKAFLLCAGKGERFYPHTQMLPKPFLPFLNIPLLAFNLFLLKSLGARQAAVNTHKKNFIFKKKLPGLFEKAGLGPPFLSHEPRLLGSAGGLLKLKSFFEGEKHFLYLNGDSMILPPLKEGLLNNFYKSHVSSKAVASLLVRPAELKTSSGLWAYPNTNQALSFSPKPKAKHYDFSGLALFSARIFKEIKPKDFHIFKDVLSSKDLISHVRVHAVSGLQLWDMNQLSSYLKAVDKALHILSAGQNTKLYQAGRHLKNVLDTFSPGWDFFKGENYFSAAKIKKPPLDKKKFLFCGKKVKGLEYLSLKNFAVLGDYSHLKAPLLLERAVLGEKAALKHSIKSALYL